MTQYLYPQNLTAKSNIWLWGMKDFVILCIAVLISVVLFTSFGWLIPAVITMIYLKRLAQCRYIITDILELRGGGL